MLALKARFYRCLLINQSTFTSFSTKVVALLLQDKLILHLHQLFDQSCCFVAARQINFTSTFSPHGIRDRDPIWDRDLKGLESQKLVFKKSVSFANHSHCRPV
jgi:hypothetical protein